MAHPAGFHAAAEATRKTSNRAIPYVFGSRGLKPYKTAESSLVPSSVTYAEGAQYTCCRSCREQRQRQLILEAAGIGKRQLRVEVEYRPSREIRYRPNGQRTAHHYRGPISTGLFDRHKDGRMRILSNGLVFPRFNDTAALFLV